MWIRSQDSFKLVKVEQVCITKRVITWGKLPRHVQKVEPNNALKVAAELNNKGYKVIETYGGGDNPRVVYEKPELDYWINDLGHYPTKERALEVLESIEKEIILGKNVYELPRE